MTSDLISRREAIDALMPIYKSASLRNRNVFSTARKCMVTIEELPSAQPDNQINLCDSCDYSYPDCPSKNGDVIFGNNIGNDNICACNKYNPSAQSDVHDRNVGEWDMFDLITSAYYGKTMYSKQDNGIVYSRYSCKYMSVDEAIREFLAVIGEDRE